ncbi:hypothetical protein H6G41_01655 [Tolypothrix sp. FACHB-123]|uniref:hypothetical protein n=1 Tax=Tolypothrix sp. FACHB-123 TaxID=2692868 RepID=UPI00168A3F4B|nr:hypothetical protein [Tolypothrix sp. FACHB-123]MBD2353337.1 hypothetical protein [Tolypothrix sp. FACHB-123]
MTNLNLMDDKKLISQYVQGKTKLAFNQNFRIESISTTIQLLTKKGFLLASINLSSSSKVFLVRQNSNHLELINEVLLENNFIPTGKIENGLMRYEYYHIPAGYQMNYTEVRYVWKLWRAQTICRDRNQAKLKLMIFTGNGFQNIHEMAFSRESLYITTTNNEVLVQAGDRVIWLSAEQSQSEPTTAIQAHTTLKSDRTPAESNTTANNLLDLYQEQIQPSEQLLSMAAITTNNIVRFDQGKLYIQTSEGEIVVEGSNLKFSLNERRVENFTAQPVSVR